MGKERTGTVAGRGGSIKGEKKASKKVGRNSQF